MSDNQQTFLICFGAGLVLGWYLRGKWRKKK